MRDAVVVSGSVAGRHARWRLALVSTVVLVGSLMTMTMTAAGQAKPAAPKKAEGGMSKEQKITNAMAAGPASISSKATIMDWPASEGAKPAVLRQGSNGWVCYPDFPGTKGNDPMCLDDSWQAWMDAYMAKTQPKITHAGVGYMIAPGGAWGSNTDPYAEKEAPGNDWGYDPPHVMMLVPNADALKELPTDRKSGGPWVMWSGTPYAHIMAPVTSMKAPAAAKNP
jgi:hypothetical protein